MDRGNYLIIVPPAYTGVAFLFCWTYFLFYATSAGVEAAAPISLYSSGYMISAASMIGTLLLISFMHIDRTAFLTSKRTKIATGAALPASTAILIFTCYNPHIVLGTVSGAVTGVFSGIMLLQWVVAYQRIGLRAAAASFPMLMAISVGVCATLMYFPHAIIGAATIIFPVISELLFHEVRKKPWPRFEDEVADLPDRPINFTLMLLPFAVYALASGFLDYSSGNNNYTFVFYAFGTFIPVVISGVYLFIVEREHFIATFLIPLAFFTAVCIPFLALHNTQPFSQVISIGELGIEVLIFIVPVGFAEFFSIDSLKTYALGRAVYVLFNAIGWYAALFAYGIYGQFLHSQVSLAFIFIGAEVLAICLIVAIVKAKKIVPGDQDTSATSKLELRSHTEKTREENAAEPQSDANDDSATIDYICREYRLSQRERDVFTLLARGYTSTRIQKELYIAAGTVNYHSRNIYAKLGVHSKQELIAMFEETRSASHKGVSQVSIKTIEVCRKNDVSSPSDATEAS